MIAVIGVVSPTIAGCWKTILEYAFSKGAY